jgi:hypothetical protein
MVTKAEQTLVRLLLTEPIKNELNFFASKLAGLRPEGSFYLAVNPSTPKWQELRFKYSFTSARKKEVNVILALHVLPPPKQSNSKDWACRLEFRQLKLNDNRAFRSDASRIELRSYMVDRAFGFTKAAMEDQVELFEEIVDSFERAAAKQVIYETTRHIKRESNRKRAAIKKTIAAEALRQSLFTTYKLDQSLQAPKLFEYLQRHCNDDLKLIEQMFKEMAHIIQ